MTMTPSSLLNTAFVMPLLRPLCQKPPSPMIVSARCSLEAPKADAAAGPKPYPMIELPRLNGANVEKEWQPISELMCT